MKNIHILPTDKPSRLCYDKDDNLLFAPNAGFTIADGKQNIYITSNEDPKNKDYYWDENKLKVKRYFESRESFPSLLHRFKVILTTDPTLIADGIQSIDDEFLEWFVKNPSCEFVQTLWTIPAYKIEKEYRIEIPKEEPKQETLEEYIERLKDRRTEDDYPYTDEDFIDYMEHIEDSHKNNLSVYKCLEFMYFAERKSEQVKDITYWKNNAEEDLREAFGQGWMIRERFDDLSPEIVYPDGLDYEEKQEYAFNLWFNQFKKK
jgi:hypothetical protein